MNSMGPPAIPSPPPMPPLIIHPPPHRSHFLLSWRGRRTCSNFRNSFSWWRRGPGRTTSTTIYSGWCTRRERTRGLWRGGRVAIEEEATSCRRPQKDRQTERQTQSRRHRVAADSLLQWLRSQQQRGACISSRAVTSSSCCSSVDSRCVAVGRAGSGSGAFFFGISPFTTWCGATCYFKSRYIHE